MDVRQAVSQAMGQNVLDIAPLGGGCIGQVYLVQLANQGPLVVKVDSSFQPRLDIEAYMLRYLARHSRLPVPTVLYYEPELLIMSHLPGNSRFSASAQMHSAELLAELHTLTAPAYGLEKDTLIGGLHQPNPWTDSWLDFFREQRLLHRAQAAHQAGRLPADVLRRIERFCGRLEQWLVEPARPSLLHGDVWTTNVLAAGDRITGFIDPAIYYGHPEIELAFTTLFGTFDEPFFDRYHEITPIAPGFFGERRDIYNLYPLLVHVHLFGGSYVGSVTQTLHRFGC